MACLIQPGAAVSCDARLSGTPFWMNETRLKIIFGGRGQNAAPTPPTDARGRRTTGGEGLAHPARLPSAWPSIGMDGETRHADFPCQPTSKSDLVERDARHADTQKDAGRLRRPASGEASNAGISGLRFRPVPRRRRRRAVRSTRRGRWRGPGRSSRHRRHLR